MSDQSGSIGKLVFDAKPDPPRISNFDDPIVEDSSQDQKQKKNANIPYADKSNSTADNTSEDKTKNFKYSKSKKKPKPQNNYIFNCANVNIGSTVKHVYKLNNYQNIHSTTSDKSDKKTPKQMTVNIKALSKSEKAITKNDILIIKEHMGNGWKEVAKKIGFTQGEIDQLLEDNKHKKISEVIFNLLTQWKSQHTKDATIGKLVLAMWTSEEYECVEKLTEACDAF